MIEVNVTEKSFGPGWQEVAVLVGRVVMHAAIVETEIEFLVSSLGDIAQHESAGLGFAKSAQVVKAQLRDYEANDDEIAFAARVRKLLKDVDKQLALRNFVVHAVWQLKDPDGFFGWKPVRGEKTPAAWLETHVRTSADFEALTGALGELLARVKHAQRDASAFPSRPVPRARAVLYRFQAPGTRCDAPRCAAD